MERIILHSDLNNFYASVETLYNPELRGKPLAVSGDADLRHGVVLAKSYEAKKYGIMTGEPIISAKRKCPDLILKKANFPLYLKFSKLAREIYADYTDKLEPFGLDECWLDISDIGKGKDTADEIRERVKFELGVSVSVGVSFNKTFAKLGSDLKKPDATTVITRDNFKEVVWPLNVSDLLYVGKSTKRKLNTYGIYTIGDLAASELRFLEYMLGKNGAMLWTFANGLENSPVSNIGAKSLIKSIGNSTTTPRDLVSDEDVRTTLYLLCESVSARMREQDFVCRTVQLHLRDNELFSFERQAPLPYPNRTVSALFETAYALYKKSYTGEKPLRSIGVRACNLIHMESEQLSIDDEVARLQKKERLDSAVDGIRERFGHFSVRRGIHLADRGLSGISPKDDNLFLLQ